MADLASMAADVAAKFGIPTNIFSALINKESGFNPNVPNGKAGEIGMTQVMPATAVGMGFNPQSLKDPLTGMTAGATYLAAQYKKFGNWNDALAAYNAGPGNIAAGQPYASAVLGAAGGVSGATTPGTQAAATGVPGVSSASVAGAASGSKVWYYAVAILIILILVVFGVWGTVKS